MVKQFISKYKERMQIVLSNVKCHLRCLTHITTASKNVDIARTESANSLLSEFTTLSYPFPDLYPFPDIVTILYLILFA